jgi:hypothetical protein
VVGNALVFTERGVYRSGETVFISALLRDGLGTGAPALRGIHCGPVGTFRSLGAAVVACI